MLLVGLAVPVSVSKGAQNKCSGALVVKVFAVQAGSELESQSQV